MEIILICLPIIMYIYFIFITTYFNKKTKIIYIKGGHNQMPINFSQKREGGKNKRECIKIKYI